MCLIIHELPQKITSYEELSKVIQEIRSDRFYLNAQNVQEIYRGQANDSWGLEPNIIRNLKGCSPKKVKKNEKAIITEFKQQLEIWNLNEHIQTRWTKKGYHDDWLLIAQAQHYGIPTRFMDWTLNWQIALYFAVCDSKYDGLDGQFWIYFSPREILISENDSSMKHLNSDPFEFNNIALLNASTFYSDNLEKEIAQRRKMCQNGKFLIQPYETIYIPLEEQEYFNKNLHKIIIPSDCKEAMRKELDNYHINYNTVMIKTITEIDAIVKDLQTKYKL
ncbi:MAG: FRG domain-containing protein [Candidatus Symbiothrix sp.]|jgi:hypothetical protein|nr:FRG domain-containing protein [Candidatus Symbiothrix sp.]